jgi:hypothetical protein
MRRLTCLVLMLLLGGCTLFESKAERARRNSPDFKAGYRDGCGSANNRGADPLANPILRDEEAYRTNDAYHAGWGTGFSACRTAGAMNGLPPPGRGPIADPSPGGTP